MSYVRRVTIRFSDTDPFGIAHYPRLVDAVHETSDVFMAEIGFPYWELTAEAGYGLPLVDMEFSFERPVEAGDEVTIGLTPDLGDRSVGFAYEATHDGETAFSGYEQRVCARTDDEGAIEVPADLREAMEPYTED